MYIPKLSIFANYLLFESRGLMESLSKVVINIEIGGLKKALPYIARQGGLPYSPPQKNQIFKKGKC